MRSVLCLLACAGSRALSGDMFSVAPMVAHTHRHYHYFWRILSKRSTLYTEMVPAAKLVAAFESGLDADWLLNNALDDRIVLQLGGGDAGLLEKAAAIGADLGFREINLNCGCPSFAVAAERRAGAALMRDAAHVADLCAVMRRGAGGATISVKHRLGVALAVDYDREADSHEAAAASAGAFVEAVSQECSKFIVHCRLALLEESSVDENGVALIDAPGVDKSRLPTKVDKAQRVSTLGNRQIPPLRRAVASELARDYPGAEFIVNGGIVSVDDARELIDESNLGVMVGRAAINHPASFARVDAAIYGDAPRALNHGDVLDAYLDYVRSTETAQTSVGEKKQLLSPVYHLFNGEPCAGAFMRRLKGLANKKLETGMSAAAVLSAAAREVTDETRLRPLDEAMPILELPTYALEEKRAGPFQLLIH